MAQDWSKEELQAAVNAYAEMYKADQEGRRVNKAQMYRNLEARFGRKDKAFERRMMNISHVVASMGGTPVRGLLPAPNIGPTVLPIIEKFVEEAGFLQKAAIQASTTEASDTVTLDTKVALLLDKWGKSGADILPPEGLATPTRREANSTSFNRCPEVKAWVIRESGYRCESCGKEAPFKREDGMPYLEVHHVVTLAEGGKDTVSNTVAVCPDCHRALHYSKDRDCRADQLYKSVNRLKRSK